VYLEEEMSMADKRDIRDWDGATARGVVLVWDGPALLRSSATEDRAYWDDRLPVSSPRGRDPGENVGG
jgi:hypothetical protein